MARDKVNDLVSQDGSQFVVVANYVMEEAGGDQNEAGPIDASEIFIWERLSLKQTMEVRLRHKPPPTEEQPGTILESTYMVH